ncbi:MAG: hypothetical protein ACI4QI_03915 [Candidatus Coproplasma sp.]
MAKQNSRLHNYDTTEKDVLTDKIDVASEKARRQRQEREMNDKIDEMAQKTLEFYHTYGKDDYRYQMMVTFLDVAFQMKEAISIITSVRVATSYLSTAIEFIDDTVTLNEEFDKQLLSKSYGAFASLKRRFRTWRAMRNNRKRMATVISNISDRLETANLITDSLRAGFEKMRLTMLRNSEKRRKKEEKRAKKSGTPLPTSQPSAAEKYIMQMAEEQGVKPSETKQDGSDSNGGAGVNGSGAGDRGIDDIIG